MAIAQGCDQAQEASQALQIVRLGDQAFEPFWRSSSWASLICGCEVTLPTHLTNGGRRDPGLKP